MTHVLDTGAPEPRGHAASPIAQIVDGNNFLRAFLQQLHFKTCVHAIDMNLH